VSNGYYVDSLISAFYGYYFVLNYAVYQLVKLDFEDAAVS
jgi:hypothetical protein